MPIDTMQHPLRGPGPRRPRCVILPACVPVVLVNKYTSCYSVAAKVCLNGSCGSGAPLQRVQQEPACWLLEGIRAATLKRP